VKRLGVECDNKTWGTYSEKDDFADLGMCCGWITSAYHSKHLLKF